MRRNRWAAWIWGAGSSLALMASGPVLAAEDQDSQSEQDSENSQKKDEMNSSDSQNTEKSKNTQGSKSSMDSKSQKATGEKAENEKAGSSKKAEATKIVVLHPESFHFTEVPHSEGAQAASLWGDMKKGSYGAMMRYPGGWKVMDQSQSHALKQTVIKGTLVLTDKAGHQQRLGAGSFAMIPAGTVYSAGCDSAKDCWVLQQQEGAYQSKSNMGQARTPKAKQR